jgi:hypothetical protein
LELPATLRSAQRYAQQKDIPVSDPEAVARLRGLTPQEKERAVSALEGGPLTKGIRFVGGFDPTKNPLALIGHLGTGFLTGGTSLPYSGMGTVANRLGNYINQTQLNDLRQAILQRSALGQQPQFQRQQIMAPYYPTPGQQNPVSIGVLPRGFIGAARGLYGGLLDQDLGY